MLFLLILLGDELGLTDGDMILLTDFFIFPIKLNFRSLVLGVRAPISKSKSDGLGEISLPSSSLSFSDDCFRLLDPDRILLSEGFLVQENLSFGDEKEEEEFDKGFDGMEIGGGGTKLIGG